MTDTQKETPTFVILASAIAALKHDTVKTEDDLMTLVMDIQEHDKVKEQECLAALLVAGAVARKRSIEYSEKTKGAKDKAERLDRYNRWAAANPSQALNPLANLAMQYAFGVIDKTQHDLLANALNGAQSSIKTHEVAVETAKEQVA